MLSAQYPPNPLQIPRFDHTQDPSVPRSSALFFQEINRLVADSVSPLSNTSIGTVEDDEPASPSGNYHYASSAPAPRSPSGIYDSYAAPYPYPSEMRRDESFSPSPAPLPQSMGPLSAPHSQDRFQISESAYTPGTRLDALSDRQSRYGTLPKLSMSNVLLDQRRMSEPAVPYMQQAAPASGAQNRAHQYGFPNYETSPHSPESPFLSRVASLGSLRHDYSPSVPHPDWKQDAEEQHRPLGDVSPYQPSFSGGISGSPPLQYAVRGEDTYGPSPPGTGTSSSSTAPGVLPPLPSSQDSPGDPSGNKKTYSFVALPGNAVRKRPRRRYDEIERLYHCSWPECNKAYGTLNHLNAHVQMQKHGAKRSPNEFKELRKQWRKAKKEYESPGLGPIRRSMSLRREHHDLYRGHPYSAPHRSFSHNSALSPPLSVSIPHMRTDGSYIVDHRYSPDNRGEIDPQQPYGGVDYRQQSAPTGWPAASSSRAETYQSPLSAQPSYPYLDNSHAQMIESPPSTNPYHSPSRSTMNRLPPDSMLLTPLVASGQVTDSYADNYYDDKSRGGRADQGSGDEY
ncbi:Zn finger family DNA binding protein [Mycena maculata]|uniref:Zn finger family DNA binding protein n=1 Tax=Mycena maculata TaxID=230809 RepID=A0AAD7NLG3_9AGAR|nr:Zn finger family DNA binding protein [Mycena maculata]